jgi:hypothetical protein
MDRQKDNLKNIEELTIKLNGALQKIDEQTRIQLEDHNLQINGISMALQRVQIGVDRTLHDLQKKTGNKKKPVITTVA